MIVALGFAGGVRNVVENRTQGGDVGRVIAAESESGDVVVYCPDQLGPGGPVGRSATGRAHAGRVPDG